MVQTNPLPPFLHDVTLFAVFKASLIESKLFCQEWNWPNPGCIEESEDEVEDILMKSTDEIFDDLEAVVQGWKKNLELIVAEGLKTIKKTTKERKMMMKYLPGDGLIGG